MFSAELNVNLKLLKCKSRTLYERGAAANVEATGIEPVSKHIRRKLSTCLFPHCLSGRCRNETHQQLP